MAKANKATLKLLTKHKVEGFQDLLNIIESLIDEDTFHGRHINILTKHHVHLSTELKNVKLELKKQGNTIANMRRPKWTEDA